MRFAFRFMGTLALSAAVFSTTALANGPLAPTVSAPIPSHAQRLAALIVHPAAFAGIQAFHERLRAHAGAQVRRGEACAALTRAAKMSDGATAQYRCIVAGEGLTAAGSRRP